MDAERWNKIQEIFGEVADLDEQACDSRLSDLCKDDHALFEEIKSLINADRTGHPLLDDVAVQRFDSLVPQINPGQTIGKYKLIREIGVGGMGRVYLANRSDGEFDQEVAVKMIHPAALSEVALKRFRSERQILARLRHPNIAQLYDGGISDEGIPYFTMEYIDGKPLTQYCRERRLGLRDRLKLFVKICEAVQYAHQNLIVHRDLKPGNILVTEEGKLKLLDFGIARLSESDTDDGDVTRTRMGERAMTPQYAAPEQILGESVTVSADVYALGIVLYEMLCDRRPFQDREDRIRDLLTASNETTPEPPSRINDKQRTITGGNTGQRISKDLDNICLMALRREPERRYPSVTALQEDVQRYLQGRPVSARKPTWAYRARKYIKRNQKSLAVAAIAGLLLIGTVTIYSLRLAEERDRARLEAQKASQVSQFLMEIFEVADPYLTNGDTITARTLLNRGANRIHEELAGQPHVRAAMMSTMGSVFLSLGLPADAEPLIDSSLYFYRKNSDLSPDFAETLMRKGDLQFLIGQYEEGSSTYQEAQQLYTQLGEEYRYQMLQALSGMGRMLSSQRKSEAAEAVYREVIAGEKELLSADDPRRTFAMARLASIVRHQGNYDEAQALLEKSLRIRQRHYGDDHMEVANAHHELGMLLHRRRLLDSTEAHYLESLRINERVLGNNHLETATCLQVLADLYKDQKRYDEAENAIRKSLEIRLDRLGPKHSIIATCKDFLGRILRRKGQLQEALRYHQEALALKIETRGRKHTSTANTMNNLAKVVAQLGDLSAAEAYFREALEIYTDQLGPEFPDAATALHNLAYNLYEQEKYAQAAPFFRQSAKYQEQLVGAGHRRTTNEYRNLGRTLAAIKKYAAADSAYREQIRRLEINAKDNQESIADAWQAVGNCQWTLKNPGSAREALEKSLAIYQRLPEEQSALRETLELLVSITQEQKDVDAATRYRDLLGQIN